MLPLPETLFISLFQESWLFYLWEEICNRPQLRPVIIILRRAMNADKGTTSEGNTIYLHYLYCVS